MAAAVLVVAVAVADGFSVPTHAHTQMVNPSAPKFYPQPFNINKECADDEFNTGLHEHVIQLQSN